KLKPMAFSVEDLNDLLELLRQHPEWREAVRREVLTRELLELPEIVQRLADRVDQLTIRLEQLTVTVNQLSTDVRELAAITRRLDGRVANLEGWRYEQKFN